MGGKGVEETVEEGRGGEGPFLALVWGPGVFNPAQFLNLWPCACVARVVIRCTG